MVLIYSNDTDVFLLSRYYSVALLIPIWLHRKEGFVPCQPHIEELAGKIRDDPKDLACILLAAYCLSGNDCQLSFSKRKKNCPESYNEKYGKTGLENLLVENTVWKMGTKCFRHVGYSLRLYTEV